MKNLKARKRGKKVKGQVKVPGAAFMSMQMPPHIIKHINREMQKAS